MAEPMTLYLVRHARAAERGARYPDDARRPLVAEGERQAERLASALERLDVRLDRLFSSPHLRAAQTARPLAVRLGRGAVEPLDALAGDRVDAMLDALASAIAPDDRRVACVGHAPTLAELASLLLTGDPDGAEVRLGKGSLLILSGTPAPEGMALEGFVRAGALKRLLRRRD